MQANLTEILRADQYYRFLWKFEGRKVSIRKLTDENLEIQVFICNNENMLGLKHLTRISNPDFKICLGYIFLLIPTAMV